MLRRIRSRLGSAFVHAAAILGRAPPGPEPSGFDLEVLCQVHDMQRGREWVLLHQVLLGAEVPWAAVREAIERLCDAGYLTQRSGTVRLSRRATRFIDEQFTLQYLLAPEPRE